ncbi:MAG: hypothetical protein C0601_06885 [Candidatus Muiribacterium halophilum]|uniref:Uncharacterized protein n=1 Tax=Muiribacterium halophilum TaxID=2053465 RepID=A0A2N5ZGB7_MUIH1|nr:MAG: hypothetical protein C0601_06885 [Candidatus Muirbacterium halophilum]
MLINEDHEIKITLMSERSKNNIFSFLIDIENIFKENKEDQKYILLVDMKEFGPYNDKLIKDMLNGTLKNKDKIYIRKVDEREFQPVKNLFGDSDKIKEKIKSIDDEQKIKINYCDLNELLKVPGLSLKNAQNILDDRQEGIFIDDVYDLVDKFEIMPHHIGSIESQIDFAHKSEEIKQEITIMTPERKGIIIDF